VLQLVFQMHVSCVSSAFLRTLQVLHPDDSKVDCVLHLCLHFSTASPSPRCLLLPLLAGHPPPPPSLLDAGVAICCCCWPRAYAWEVEGRKRGLPTRATGWRGPRIGGCGGDGVQARRPNASICPDVRALALPKKRNLNKTMKTSSFSYSTEEKTSLSSIDLSFCSLYI
jgi:hypothetical protein